MARIEGKSPDELALRSAIAFSERVDGIEFAHIVAGSVGELIRVQPSETRFCHERGEKRFQRWNQKLRRRKSE